MDVHSFPPPGAVYEWEQPARDPGVIRSLSEQQGTFTASAPVLDQQMLQVKQQGMQPDHALPCVRRTHTEPDLLWHQHQQQQQQQQHNQEAFPFEDQEDFLRQLLDGYHTTPPCPGEPGGSAAFGSIGSFMDQQAYWNTPKGVELAPYNSQALNGRDAMPFQSSATMMLVTDEGFVENEVGSRQSRTAGGAPRASIRGSSIRKGRGGARKQQQRAAQPSGGASRGGRGDSRGARHNQPPADLGIPAGAEGMQRVEADEKDKPSSTSQYRGVTRHKRSGRWEAHIWIKELKRQIYLGGYEHEEHAAEAYDVAALKTKGQNVQTNFDVERYHGLSGCMHTISLEELIMAVRRQSQGHSRGTSAYRGVTSHPSGRWESRIGVPGSKHVYLGLFNDESEAAKAYDRSLVRLRGKNAATNCALSDYAKEMEEHNQAQVLAAQMEQPLEAIMPSHEYELWVKNGPQQDAEAEDAPTTPAPPCGTDMSGLHMFYPPKEQDYLAIATAAANSLNLSTHLPVLPASLPFQADFGWETGGGGRESVLLAADSAMSLPDATAAVQQLLQQLGEGAGAFAAAEQPAGDQEAGLRAEATEGLEVEAAGAAVQGAQSRAGGMTVDGPTSGHPAAPAPAVPAVALSASAEQDAAAAAAASAVFPPDPCSLEQQSVEQLLHHLPIPGMGTCWRTSE